MFVFDHYESTINEHILRIMQRNIYLPILFGAKR